MKKWASIALVAFVAAALSVTYVWAQQPPPRPDEPPAARHAAPPPPGPPREWPSARRDRPAAGPMEDSDLRQMVEVVMMAKLSSKLGLSDKQAMRMVRSREKARDDMQKLSKQRREKLKALENALKGKRANDADVNAKLKEVMALDDKITALRRHGFEAAAEGLTPTQRAKLYIFFNEFENDMRQLIMRARQRGMQRPREGMPESGPREMLREQFRENVRRNFRDNAPRPRRPVAGEKPPQEQHEKGSHPDKR